MKRIVLYVVCLLLCPTVVLYAQIKGDPVFGGVAADQTDLQKQSTKMSSDLKKLYDTYTAPKTKITESTKKPVPTVDDFSRYMQIRGDKVVVDITVKGDMQSAKAELQQVGVTITASFGRVISGLIPIAALPQLDATGSVRFVRPAYKPQHVGKPGGYPGMSGSLARLGGVAKPDGVKPDGVTDKVKATPVISQGDTAQLSYQIRKKNKVDGKNVKVGILSDSYNNLGTAALGVARGELPGPGNPLNYKKPVQVLEDLPSGGTDEGRAMLEIVHDVAPAAELAFHTADMGQADMAQGILQLASAGCNVLADDVLYYAEPFFQDGIIAQAVDQVKSQGVTYFSAAGNQSIRSYESDYRPTLVSPLGVGNGTAHNFSGPTDAPRYFQPIYIPSGGSIITSFQWDQSSFSASGVGASSDLDIYLLDVNGRVVAGGASDNIASGDPIEVFGYLNNTPNVTFYLVIVKFAGPDPGRLKYVLFNDALFYLTTPAIPGILSPALYGHAKAEGAIATGAAFYLQTPAYGVDTPVVEGYSSVGGTPNYYDISGNRIAPLVRHKPDIVAPDGVNTSFFNPFGNGDIPQDTDTFPNFFGTSAAAPHAAGVAALMIDAQKLGTITPSQIKGILSTNTWDMDDPYTTGFDKGFDFTTGFGLINAANAVGVVKFPNFYIKDLSLTPLCSNDPRTVRNWQIVNPNPFDVAVTWQIAGTSQQGSLVVQPGDTTFTTNAVAVLGIPLPMIGVIQWQDNFGFPRTDLAYSSSAVCGKDVVSTANSDALLAGASKGLPDASPGRIAIAEVYPNPSSGLFRLYLSAGSGATGEVNLELYSAEGRRLQIQRVGQSTGVIDINASGYRPGVYFLKVIQGGTVKTIKLIKK